MLLVFTVFIVNYPSGSFDQYEPLLEPILVSYVEHLAKTEDVNELTEGDVPDQLVYALGLCELLVPTMRNTNILLAIGKLLALTHGASHHYTHHGQSKVGSLLFHYLHLLSQISDTV